MRVKQTDEDWLSRIEAWKTSGKTQTEFCREAGISVWTFRDRLKKTTETKRLTEPWVEVPTTGPEGGLIQVLWPEGTQLKFPPSIQPEYLAAVIRVLRR